MAITFEDESPVKGRIVFDDEKPKRSLINRLTGGAIITRSDEGFRPAETGFAPLQAYRAIRPLLDNPEVQAALTRVGGAVSGGVMGGIAGAPVAGVGAIPGAILGAIAGASAVEPTAQSITPREESLAETSINLASAGLPPLGRIASVAPRLASVVNPRVLQAVGEGAYGVGVGEAQLLGQKLLEEGRLPTADEAKNTALIGGLVGVAGGGILPTPVGEGAIPQVPKSTQILQDAAKPKSLANVASESAAKTGGNPYAVQESINKMMQIPDPIPMAPITAKESAQAMEPLIARREAAMEAFQKQAQLDEQFRIARAEEALQQAEAARLAQPEIVQLTSSPANQRLQMLDTVEGNAARERARLQQIVESENPPLPQIQEPILSPQAQRMQDEYGRINPQLLAPLAGAGTGGAIGYTQTERQEGESEEAFQARRLANAAIGTGIGLAGGATARTVVNKVLSNPIRKTNSPILKEVDTILTPKKSSSSLMEKLGDLKTGFRYNFNTRYAPIGEAQRALYKESGRQFTPNRYYDLERDFERVSGAPVKAEGEVKILEDLIKEIPTANTGDFDRYLVLSRIEDRLLNDTDGRKRVADWTADKARAGLTELEAEVGPQVYAQIQKAGQDYQDLMRRTLQIQVDSGRMSQEVMDGVLDSSDFYAPFKVLKHFEDEEAFVKGGGKRINSSEQLIKKMTGIDDEDFRIELPTNVAAEQVYKGYILAEKNMKMRRLATLSRLDPDGDYVKLITEDAKPRKGYEKVSYFQNGDKKYLEVSDGIAKALAGMDGQETGVILNGLGLASTAFKMGATGLSIPFNIANLMVFDPIRLGVISKYGFRNPVDMAWTLVEWPKALASSVSGNLLNKPNQLYQEWIESGAANSTLARVLTPEAFASRNPTQKKLSEVMMESNFGTGKALKAAALLSNTLEETTKLWGLQRAKRIERLDKLSPQELERKWSEIVTEIRNYAGSPDFARAGVLMKPLNIVLPFLNPRWQGASQDMARLNPFLQGNAKDAGAAWARMGSIIAVPTAALAVYNLQPDNEADFMQIPEDERKRYHHIPLYADDKGEPTILGTGTPYRFNNKDGVSIRGYYRIPKREFPGLLSNTIEDFMVYTKGSNPPAFEEIASSFAQNFVDTASPVSVSGDTVEERISTAAAGLNPALRLPLEAAVNRSFFTGRNIVPESRANASPEKRYSESTPEIYKDIAGAIPEAAPEILRSPANLQHLAEGLTGGFVRQFAPPQLSEGNPALDANPVLNRFFRSERIDNAELMRGAQEAERARTDQRIDEQEIASELAEAVLARQTPQEKQKVLSDAFNAGLITPDIEKRLIEEIKDAQRGLSYEDRVIKRSYTVSGGFRAKYYADKLASMPRGEQAAYIQEQARKGLLTDEVAKQLGGILNQPQRR